LDIRQQQSETEEKTEMALNLSDTDAQGSREPIPAGVYRLRARLMAGTAGPDFLLRRAKNTPVLLMVALECTVIGSEHAGRKVWDYISAEIDEESMLTPLDVEKRQNLQTAIRMGRNKLRAIIDSAFAFSPDDKTPATQAKRDAVDYVDFDGICFYAQVEVRPARNGYKASNEIYFIVTPDLPDYPKQAPGANNLPATPKQDLQDEMDDSIPF
jgi:hypothetical protein